MYEVESVAKKTTKSIDAALTTALMARRNVSKEDMALTAAGKYEEAPLENARRLDAIMDRGFAELSAHPDWAGILRIPESVLSGSEADLKAWAAERNKLVSVGASVEDVNWDAFLVEYEKNLKIAEGKAEVLQRAAEEVYKAGLAGSVGEAKQQVQEQMGDITGVKVAPKFSSEAVSTSFITAFEGVNFSAIINTAMKKEEAQIKSKGKIAGVWFGDGFLTGIETELTGVVAS